MNEVESNDRPVPRSPCMALRHLNHLLGSCPRLNLVCGENEYYRRARIREQSLVSCTDDCSVERFFTESQLLTLKQSHTPLGAVSVASGVNKKRATTRNLHGRIDLVMVEPKMRGFGFGRLLLLLSAVGFLLKQDRERLYSLSCLAAHEAVEKVLEVEAGFRRDALTGLNYTRQILDVDDRNIAEKIDHVCAELERAVRIVGYRLRQRPSRCHRRVLPGRIRYVEQSEDAPR